MSHEPTSYEIGSTEHIENAVEYLRDEYPAAKVRGRKGRVTVEWQMPDVVVHNLIIEMQEWMFMVNAVNFEDNKISFESV